MSKNYVIVTQYVKVRKYEIDKDQFVDDLRLAKSKSKMTQGDIAAKLDVTLTELGHWFRKDKYFNPPNPEIWQDVKNLIDVDGILNKYDLQVLTFIEKVGTFDKAERVYLPNAICPTVLSTDTIKVFSK